MKRLWLPLAGALVMALAAVLLVNVRESAIKDERQRLSVVPRQFAVSHIFYAKEATSGFGLSGGDNESGVIVYELPQSIAREMRRSGLAYFRDLDPKSGGDRWSVIEAWRTTPIPASHEWAWADRSETSLPPPPTLSGYLGHLGFPIDVDSKVASDIDDSISSPGSFYAATRYGVWIVIPAKNKVVYAYRS